MIGKKLSYEEVASLFPQTFSLVNLSIESSSARSRTTSGKRCSAGCKESFQCFCRVEVDFFVVSTSARDCRGGVSISATIAELCRFVV